MMEAAHQVNEIKAAAAYGTCWGRAGLISDAVTEQTTIAPQSYLEQTHPVASDYNNQCSDKCSRRIQTQLLFRGRVFTYGRSLPFMNALTLTDVCNTAARKRIDFEGGLWSSKHTTVTLHDLPNTSSPDV